LKEAQQICHNQEGWAVKSCQFQWGTKGSPKEDVLGQF